MTEKFLRDQLVGAWELTSFIERDIATGVENHPFGKHPQGLILYTPDGYVSAQLQLPERPPFADEDPLHATPDEYAAAGRSYVAYSGRFFAHTRRRVLASARAHRPSSQSRRRRPTFCRATDPPRHRIWLSGSFTRTALKRVLNPPH
jgi:hypothetical protein